MSYLHSLGTQSTEVFACDTLGRTVELICNHFQDIPSLSSEALCLNSIKLLGQYQKRGGG